MNNHNLASYDMMNFTIREITECGRNLRKMGEGASSMEETANRLVRYLYERLIIGQTDRRACALARFFKTHTFENLDEELKTITRSILGNAPVPKDMKCLILVATAGEKSEWESRRSSSGHRSIPLPSVEAVGRIPMMKNLIKQVGMDVSVLVRPDPKIMLDMEQKAFNVFYVPAAMGSPYIPAQDEFVIPYGIKSVLGLGGLLPMGDVFIIILFMKVEIPKEVADLFKNIALNVKIAILPFEKTVFA